MNQDATGSTSTSTALRTAGVVLVGLVSAPALEVFSVLWMMAAPRDLDLTGNYHLSVTVPATLVLHVVVCLAAGWKLFNPNPVRHSIIFVAVHCTAQFLLLSSVGNDFTTAAINTLIVAASGTLVTATMCRYFWCETCGRARV